MKIVIIVSEVISFVKTGRLGDAFGSLPEALRKQNTGMYRHST